MGVKSFFVMFVLLGASTLSAAQEPSLPKTRAQVRQELIDAQREGIIPSGCVDYPPSERTIERNRELYLLSHRPTGGNSR